jgi:hypothetical protein
MAVLIDSPSITPAAPHSACQIATGAFEYGDLPPDGAQQVRYKQPAHRSADHQGTRPIQFAPPSF